MTVVATDAIRVENIPAELRARQAWVAYRKEGPKKVPYNSRTGRRASCSDRATWGSYEEAIAAYQGGGYDGIGFQLTAPQFVGVDLDGCRDPETGFIDDGAQAIIEQLDSYTEVSLSGRGIHIFVTGALPPGRRRTQGAELYDRDRYLTVTGQHVAHTPLTVESRSAELAALHARLFGSLQPPVSPPAVESAGSTEPHASASLSDEDLLARMTSANNGQRFERLWRGEWHPDYPSQSEADLALCATLAFWTGRDAERIDSLFRQSGLHRPKWDEVHGGATYGEVTIARAIQSAYDIWRPAVTSVTGEEVQQA